MKFKSNKDMLHAFYSYMSDRDTIPLWKTSGKYNGTEYVPQPPSIYRWSKWLNKCELEPWNKISYRSLKLCLENEKFEEAKLEIMAAIEDDLVWNTLAGNYNSNFSQKFLQQKYGWESISMDDSKIIIMGMNGIREQLEKPND